MKEIFARASVRRFQPTPVEAEKVQQLLRAAMAAPSAGNQQPWEFIVVEKKESLVKLSQMCVHSRLLADAPLAVVVLANKSGMKYPQYWQQDLGAATENLLLEAVHLGLGGVWLGVAPMEERMDYISKMYGLDENYSPFTVVALGYPSAAPSPLDRYNPAKIRYDR